MQQSPDEHNYAVDEGRVKAFCSNRIYEEKFEYMELRWLGNLVLPPSLHPSSNRYKHLNVTLPSIKPHKLELSVIEKAVSYFCTVEKLIEKSTSGYWLDEEGARIKPFLGKATYAAPIKPEISLIDLRFGTH